MCTQSESDDEGMGKTCMHVHVHDREDKAMYMYMCICHEVCHMMCVVTESVFGFITSVSMLSV